MAAVLLEDVLDGLLALVARGQVDVDVGPLAALLGEEALEEQSHRHGVDGGDAERITHGAVRGRAASLGEHRRLAGEARDVVHDQEVAGEVELLDDGELVLDLAPGLRGHRVAVALSCPVLGEDAQEGRLGLSPGGIGNSGKR